MAQKENGKQSDVSSLYVKLAKAKNKMGAVLKKSKNPYFKSNYADLNAHIDAVEPTLLEFGLVLTQPIESNGVNNVVKSVVTDVESGMSVTSALALPTFEDMQKLGGAITYARRYTLSALLGMKAEDDDGNLASNKFSKPTTTRKRVSLDDF